LAVLTFEEEAAGTAQTGCVSTMELLQPPEQLLGLCRLQEITDLQCCCMMRSFRERMHRRGGLVQETLSVGILLRQTSEPWWGVTLVHVIRYQEVLLRETTQP
jgi:hypothetical protein